jgi:leucyl aminopeptidase
MQILLKNSLTEALKDDLLVVFYDEINELPEKIGEFLKNALTEINFKTDQDEVRLIYTHNLIPVKKIIVVALKKADPTMDVWLDTVAQIFSTVKKTEVKSVSFILPDRLKQIFGIQLLSKSITEGASLSLYTFNKHQNSESSKSASKLEIINLMVSGKETNSVNQGISAGLLTTSAVIKTRDLINEPPSLTTPKYLAETARLIARDNPEVSCQILNRLEMEKLGMNALLGIAQGSEEEPKFIILTYNGGGTEKISLVGKGITFDSGGLSLKPGSAMETMKMDMAGAAAILGIFSVISNLKPKAQVTGIIAACENMPSGKAVKPGDVLKAMNGKTIEVLNTDAEGRVILADAMSYVGKFIKPKVIIDLATLTGACMVALGEDVAGLFSNRESLTKSLNESAKITGERIWELPLIPEFAEMLKSKVADIKNITKSRYGGAISGAMFIKAFVPEDVYWAHLDIAGPAFAEEAKPLTPYGGTGFGVRMLLDYLTSIK